jgi:hypothetical protein
MQTLDGKEKWEMEGENMKNIASGSIYLKENSIKLVEPPKKNK